MSSEETEENVGCPNSAFQPTLWSRVLAAGSDSPQSIPALDDLCRLYWYPIYAFLRRSGNDIQQARDLTQGFFQYVLQHGLLKRADPRRGRFRSFLLGILKNYTRDEHDRARALRRGGGALDISIDEEIAEGRYQNEPVTITNPELLLDRRWALQIVEHALELIRTGFAQAGKEELFNRLQPYLTDDDPEGFALLATRLNTTEGAARTLVCRFREQFRNRIRRAIAETVSEPGQVDVEFAHLQAALRAD